MAHSSILTVVSYMGGAGPYGSSTLLLYVVLVLLCTWDQAIKGEYW